MKHVLPRVLFFANQNLVASMQAFLPPEGRHLSSTLHTVPPQAETGDLAKFEQLQQVILRAASLLPAQGPITAFVFLNTLQAFENLPFDEGLREGARLFGCQPYLPEESYRDKLAQHRILEEDLVAVLAEELGAKGAENIAGLSSRTNLHLAMLQYPIRLGPVEELRWFVAESDALRRMRDEVSADTRERFIEETRHWIMRDVRKENDTHLSSSATQVATTNSANASAHIHVSHRQAMRLLVKEFGEQKIELWSAATWEAFALQALWKISRAGVAEVPNNVVPVRPPIRHRDLLWKATGKDSDAFVHELLIRFSAAFLDQGMANWSLPNRNRGYFHSFCEIYGAHGGPPQHWMWGLPQELERIRQAKLSPLESLAESLQLLGVEPAEWNEYLTDTLLALRGWAGMIWQNEVRGDRVPQPLPAGTLVEFLAVRMILERLAIAFITREELSGEVALNEIRNVTRRNQPHPIPLTVDQRAFLVFQVAQVSGWSLHKLSNLSADEWKMLVGELEEFHEYSRRRIFQLAFERRFRTRSLNALSIHTKRQPARVVSPQFQAVFCIDTREESFRRHLEEVAPQAETFGAAGFFGVAMYFRGVADAHYSTLCPIVVHPQHWVTEEVVYSLEVANRRRAQGRRVLGTASHRMHVGSRNIAAGALLTGLLGPLASVPLVTRVLFPHLTARIRRTADSLLAPPAVTRLVLERIAEKPGPEGDHIGYSVEEMANIGERILREIGLLEGFARLVMFFGHGSFCLNNPHKSAYDCGACSGSAGGPNARALAMMLNDPRVREILAKRGVSIPNTTSFLGGLHNTCNDSLMFFDLDLLPRTHIRDFEAARESLEKTCERNAHERCRRFQSAPLNLSLAAARRHVEGRAEDLAQTRPEFGNASNAMCVVGRRTRTRGLYLDRRSFLVSYDPSQDDADHNILGRILGAVVPVCSGINLQYFFSSIDSPGWGCGTKLPHNITSLLGVMDGAASDLRPGLPWQGVEIHEPIRLLFVIESTPAAIFQVMSRNKTVADILRNGWVQLSLLDPQSNSLLVFRDGEFQPFQPTITELPKAAASVDWYRGWRDHLEFAAIEK